jgi:hypothetical protein
LPGDNDAKGDQLISQTAALVLAIPHCGQSEIDVIAET